MSKVKIVNGLKSFIFSIEILLAVFLGISLIIGIVASAVNMPPLIHIGDEKFYETFKNILGNIFLLIVGVELIRMLVTHTMRSTLELMVFVIARKMLIYTDTMLDIILGTVAMGIVFTIIKFLIPTKYDRSSSFDMFPATLKVEELNSLTAWSIPSEEDITLEELIRKLAEGKKIVNGTVVDAGPVRLKVAAMKDHKITHIQVLDSDFGH